MCCKSGANSSFASCLFKVYCERVTTANADASDLFVVMIAARIQDSGFPPLHEMALARRSLCPHRALLLALPVAKASLDSIVPSECLQSSVVSLVGLSHRDSTPCQSGGSSALDPSPGKRASKQLLVGALNFAFVIRGCSFCHSITVVRQPTSSCDATNRGLRAVRCLTPANTASAALAAFACHDYFLAFPFIISPRLCVP